MSLIDIPAEIPSDVTDFAPPINKITLAEDRNIPEDKPPASLGSCPTGMFPSCCYYTRKMLRGVIVVGCYWWYPDWDCDEPNALGWFCCEPVMRKTKGSPDEEEEVPNVATCKKIGAPETEPDLCPT